MKKIYQTTGLLVILSFGFLSFNKPTGTIISYTDAPPIKNYTTNPPTGKTGAPGESTCTDCHSGSVLSAAGVVDFTFSGTNSSYVPGQTYNLSVSVMNGNKNGFQATILDASDQKAGTFVNGSNTNTTLIGGKEYIRQSAASGITNFQFQWTAPATNAGNLTAYYSFNKSDANGTTSGDLIYIGNEAINATSTAAISSIDANPFQIKTFWNPNTKQIHLDYNLNVTSKIVVNVQSLNGKLIQNTTIGLQNEGQYHQILETQNITPGVYIISTFVDNKVYNEKLMLN